MFEGVTEGELIDVMGESTRDESTAIALRLATVAELWKRREGQLAETAWWCADGCDAVAAEVAAQQNISHARAVSQVQFACNLWHRLPTVAAVFLSGAIDYRVVRMIVNRTENVDDELMGQLDDAIARHAQKWMKLSEPKLRDRIDLWVASFDPAGVRVPPSIDDNRHIEVNPTIPGMAGIAGHVRASDAAAFDRRLDAIAATVCPNDPRSRMQRRSDATGAIGRWEATLACQCGSQDCPVAAERKAVSDVVIHVLAEQATLDGTSDRPGYLPGYGVMPAESVRELAATAQVKPVLMPSATSDPGYRPSTATRDFTQWRDLTCRWPGCDRPVATCELDHTVPYPIGATHASDLKHYCKTHHLIKTFHTGWAEQQLPDGTLILTSPTGRSYTSEAHGAALFPALGRPSGALPLPTVEEPGPYRTVMMPRRKQTRAQNKRDRINAERRQRTELNTAQQPQRRTWHAQTYEPPPF